MFEVLAIAGGCGTGPSPWAGGTRGRLVGRPWRWRDEHAVWRRVCRLPPAPSVLYPVVRRRRVCARRRLARCRSPPRRGRALNAQSVALGVHRECGLSEMRAFSHCLQGHYAPQRSSPLDSGADRELGCRDRANGWARGSGFHGLGPRVGGSWMGRASSPAVWASEVNHVDPGARGMTPPKRRRHAS